MTEKGKKIAKLIFGVSLVALGLYLAFAGGRMDIRMIGCGMAGYGLNDSLKAVWAFLKK